MPWLTKERERERTKEESSSENASNSPKHTIDDSSNPSNHHMEADAKHFSPTSSLLRGEYQYDDGEGLGEDFIATTYYFDNYNTNKSCSIM